MNVKENDLIPNVDFFVIENGEPVKKNTQVLLKDKKVIIFGLPGAYTSVCSAKHLPGYVNMFDQYKEKGIDYIICISVNDPFVMSAWGKEHNVGDKILMSGDPFLNFIEKNKIIQIGIIFSTLSGIFLFLKNFEIKKFVIFLDYFSILILNYYI